MPMPIRTTQHASAGDHPGYIDAERLMHERDNRVCECGHKCVSHGSFTGGEFVGTGRGPCGIDRDTRNAASGYLGDACPCATFTDARQAWANAFPYDAQRLINTVRAAR